MFRVLSILVALPMLMPQGVCLRKFDCLGWLLRTSATVPASTAVPSHARTERPNDRHSSSCQCGCQERVAQDREAADGGESVGDLRVHGGTPPQPEAPCCPAICKSKLDKVVQAENPQPCGEVAFVGFTPAPTTHPCTSPQHRLPVIANGPPLYISFCTFLI